MDFRKWFRKEKILAAANKDSFYIVLFFCLVILATTAVWVTRSNIKFLSENNIFPDNMETKEEYLIEELPEQQRETATSMEKEYQKEEKEERQEEPAPKEQQNTTANQPQHAEAESQTAEQTASTAKAAQPATPKQEKMILPVLGKIIMDYSSDTLVYSATLEQWTTHYGIDISSKIGAPVKAAMSGKVSSIESHPRLGVMITIDHNNGIVTRYANLQNNTMVKQGDTVEKGKVIAGVGDTAEFETGDPPHLHFEVIKDGKHQDPKQYLPNM